MRNKPCSEVLCRAVSSNLRRGYNLQILHRQNPKSDRVRSSSMERKGKTLISQKTNLLFHRLQPTIGAICNKTPIILYDGRFAIMSDPLPTRTPVAHQRR